jgi:ribosomal protein L32E
VGDKESHNECTHRFIDLANEMKNQGYDPQLISAAMMSASGIYATYITAGNTGGLQPSGVDKVVMMYRRNLEHIQERKKAEYEGE